MILEQIFLKKTLHKLWIPLQHVYTILVNMCGWVLFRSADLGQAMHFYRKLFVYSEGSAPVNSYISFFTVNRETFIILIVACILSTPVLRALRRRMIAVTTGRKEIALMISVLHLCILFFLLLLSLTMVSAQTYNPFIYFRF
jgi:alginate O-acetyltransferase complex protein AlgI